ncbi:hypothetical protein AKUH4B114J_14800 [Apilactobacillus kunkeei]|uniref:hypothetical protein n=2 Tax=Apilactobacillus kunkeei TaxID=148814 RepID=UPI001C88F554|nr:hypothetical protein [Apilactobacillus kunkeei]MBX8454871.1 hypothetical protein [Apilactobacillus kunkeei]UZX33209.1 hypothetical protein LDX55_07310 [Apilactobacillus kunkeei]CAI2666017.1 hypothetical protein AKUH3B202M_14800 [Apilactobacillus kunkeei]CAI2669091.1 hypothetical protein AKUH3B101X_14780 [Apilactobacillus kunkeei]CAI2669313.1 hypothetical protein AKUH2B105J_14810 [Apilactobacillus kunkeei]
MRIGNSNESFTCFFHKYKELLQFNVLKKSINMLKKTFTVKFKIVPTPNSKEYIVEVNYKINEYPIVWVYGLIEENKSDDVFPHVYKVCAEENKVRLCLYMQKYMEYNKKEPFSKNIIPWICEWLNFYEIYKITGRWYGNGEHPPKGESYKNNYDED